MRHEPLPQPPFHNGSGTFLLFLARAAVGPGLVGGGQRPRACIDLSRRRAEKPRHVGSCHGADSQRTPGRPAGAGDRSGGSCAAAARVAHAEPSRAVEVGRGQALAAAARRGGGVAACAAAGADHRLRRHGRRGRRRAAPRQPHGGAGAAPAPGPAPLRPDRRQPARRTDRPQRRGHPHRAAPRHAGAPGRRRRRAGATGSPTCRARWSPCCWAAATAGIAWTPASPRNSPGRSPR